MQPSVSIRFFLPKITKGQLKFLKHAACFIFPLKIGGERYVAAVVLNRPTWHTSIRSHAKPKPSFL